MNRIRLLMIGIVLITGAPAALAEDAAAPKAAPQAAPQGPAEKAFAAMKTLVGTWKGTADGDATHPAELVYALTAGGSTVMETLFPGTEHAMVTMYHMDGKDLVLTHYCAAGNQPRMKLAAGDGSGEMKFSFAGGSNLDPGKDMHMHEASIRIVDANNLESRWVSFEAGKEAGAHSFKVARVQS
ncbi:MAG: hypothetical protein HYV63_02720 [Candidatus Schekmanbacteria bacterium]|nr:hypothetical protein [Candidatus Schekmanbacteria bacterium]